jgi:glycosyltransferase involved in cell wall biosynthesis
VSGTRATRHGKLTVLVNGVSAKSGGAVTYLRNLAASVRGGRHRYIFCLPSRLARIIREEGSDAEIVATDVGHQPPWRRFLWDQIVLRRLARRCGADVLVSSSDFGVWKAPCPELLMVRNPLYFSPLYREHILSRKSARFRLDFFLRRRLILRSVRWADLVMTASRSMLADLRRFIDVADERAAVNHFGIPLDKFPMAGTGEGPRRNGGPSGKGKRILFVSEYSDHKNLTTLLEAGQLLTRWMDEFEIVTTASPQDFPEAEIVTRTHDRALLAGASLRPHIRVVGRVPYEDIAWLYRSSDIFVFPSIAESFGHPLVEALASGLPTVAADIPTHREICGEAALYFPPLDAASLARGIRALLADPARQAHLTSIGRKRVETEFDWVQHVTCLSALVERLAGSRR